MTHSSSAWLFLFSLFFTSLRFSLFIQLCSFHSFFAHPTHRVHPALFSLWLLFLALLSRTPTTIIHSLAWSDSLLFPSQFPILQVPSALARSLGLLVTYFRKGVVDMWSCCCAILLTARMMYDILEMVVLVLGLNNSVALDYVQWIQNHTFPVIVGLTRTSDDNLTRASPFGPRLPAVTNRSIHHVM